MNFSHILVRLSQRLPHCLPERANSNHTSPVRHDFSFCQLRTRVEHDTPLHVRNTRDLLSFLVIPGIPLGNKHHSRTETIIQFERRLFQLTLGHRLEKRQNIRF